MSLTQPNHLLTRIPNRSLMAISSISNRLNVKHIQTLKKLTSKMLQIQAHKNVLAGKMHNRKMSLRLQLHNEIYNLTQQKILMKLKLERQKQCVLQRFCEHMSQVADISDQPILDATNDNQHVNDTENQAPELEVTDINGDDLNGNSSSHINDDNPENGNGINDLVEMATTSVTDGDQLVPH